ncbi:ferritin [Halosquirtibacter xylanolyticus]|uniref:ferritin n=1 Tax=Halosquirtibacter xylanolyticus TaxID=3374599 RepID=UPI0037484710|nr:ferritin [Prolixibacteraceae bacterium]
MIKEAVAKSINDQINKEYYSSYLYLSMSAFFESEGLKGFANWMRIQAKEEADHADKFFDYLNDRGGRVMLRAIDQVPTEFGSVLEVFEQVLEHEEFVTESVNNMMDIAIKENDHATKSFLQWFVDEQVEEEATVGDIINNLKLIKGDGQGILMMDRELGARSYVKAE